MKEKIDIQSHNIKIFCMEKTTSKVGRQITTQMEIFAALLQRWVSLVRELLRLRKEKTNSALETGAKSTSRQGLERGDTNGSQAREQGSASLMIEKI